MTDVKDILVKPGKGKFFQGESLSRFTHWRTGGPADFIYQPSGLEDLITFLQDLPDSIPVTWLGLGSNTLIRDGGIEGVVIVTQGGMNKLEKISDAEIRAEAGVSAGQLARFSARQSLAGLEFMAGIPGTVGGALAMNAGCFNGETWTHVKAVETIDRHGTVRVRMPKEFAVGYRSVEMPVKDEWFVAAHFELKAGNKETSLEMIRNLLEKRNNTQPTGSASCGSVFRNPPGNYAGKLIENCGLKGLGKGGAQVSEKHANFIVNEEAATSADIERLIYDVRRIVEEQTGINLIPEVCIIGRSGD